MKRITGSDGRATKPGLSLRDKIELRRPLNYEEAAAYTGRSVPALRNEVYRGRLRALGGTGRRKLFALASLDALIGDTPHAGGGR